MRVLNSCTDTVEILCWDEDKIEIVVLFKFKFRLVSDSKQYVKQVYMVWNKHC